MYRLLLITLVCLILASSLTYSWLTKTIDGPHSIHATNITAKPHVFFHQTNGTDIPASIDPVTNRYIINISDRSSPTFIEKLRINIELEGRTSAYLRIFLSDMWFRTFDDGFGNETRTIFIREDTKLLYNHLQWLDNRLYDNYFYYIYNSNTMSQPKYPQVNRGLIVPTLEKQGITFISGIDGSVAEIKDGELHLEIRVEVVQFNRMEAFWGMTELPE